jgi:hypothetical protein
MTTGKRAASEHAHPLRHRLCRIHRGLPVRLVANPVQDPEGEKMNVPIGTPKTRVINLKGRDHAAMRADPNFVWLGC